MADSRVCVYLGCSLDGCIAGPEHDLSFLNEYTPPPGAIDSTDGLGFEGFLSDVGALLMGRQTYQVLLDYDVWHYGDRPVLVATHNELPPPPKGGNARAVAGPIDELIAKAKQAADGGSVYLDGGDLVRQGLEAGLVDELCLTFLPIIVGHGVRLWDGLRSRIDLVFDAPTTHAQGMVQLRARTVKPGRA